MNNHLNRFISDQDHCYHQVLEEMRDGRKRSHWMWYIFPQIDGLGKSETAQYYALKNLEEATLYLEDKVLSDRLTELTNILVHEVEEDKAEMIFGFPDCLKFHSCMTLFLYVVQSNDAFKNDERFVCFEEAIQKFYRGRMDQKTIDIIEQ